MHKLFLSMLFILLISISSYAKEKLLKVYIKPAFFQIHLIDNNFKFIVK